jgi:hypothetical protein
MRGLFLFLCKKSAEFRIRRKAAEVRNRRAGPNRIFSGGCSHTLSIHPQLAARARRLPPAVVSASRHVAQH